MRKHTETIAQLDRAIEMTEKILRWSLRDDNVSVDRHIEIRETYSKLHEARAMLVIESTRKRFRFWK